MSVLALTGRDLYNGISLGGELKWCIPCGIRVLPLSPAALAGLILWLSPAALVGLVLRLSPAALAGLVLRLSPEALVGFVL